MIQRTETSPKSENPLVNKIADTLRTMFSAVEVDGGQYVVLEFGMPDEEGNLTNGGNFLAQYDMQFVTGKDDIKINPDETFLDTSQENATRFTTRELCEEYINSLAEFRLTSGDFPPELAGFIKQCLDEKSNIDEVEQLPLPTGFVNCEQCELYDSCLNTGYCPHENGF